MSETVWVLTIEHRHGANVSVYKTEAGALAELASYVGEWWGDLRTDDGNVPAIPSTDSEAIDLYFGTSIDEYYTLTEAEVMP